MSDSIKTIREALREAVAELEQQWAKQAEQNAVCRVCGRQIRLDGNERFRLHGPATDGESIFCGGSGQKATASPGQPGSQALACNTAANGLANGTAKRIDKALTGGDIPKQPKKPTPGVLFCNRKDR